MLTEVGIHLTSVPPVVVDPALHWPGFYQNAVVYVRDPAQCDVLAHEFVHHWQFERRGSAKSAAEQERREAEVYQRLSGK